jgi:hypothetical protein
MVIRLVEDEKVPEAPSLRECYEEALIILRNNNTVLSPVRQTIYRIQRIGVIGAGRTDDREVLSCLPKHAVQNRLSLVYTEREALEKIAKRDEVDLLIKLQIQDFILLSGLLPPPPKLLFSKT